MLSERYITDRFLPDKAIDLIDEACSDVNLKNPDLIRADEVEKEIGDYARERELLASAPPKTGDEYDEQELDRRYERIAELRSREMQLQTELDALRAKGRPELTADNLARIIELWTKIPAASIRADEFEQLAGLGDRLRAHIVGQDQAIDTVCAAIRRNRVGLQAKRKPVSFLFVGGTGVGKTELVKRLADELFHAPESLIRLDMSEYMEKFSVSRMIGSPRATSDMTRPPAHGEDPPPPVLRRPLRRDRKGAPGRHEPAAADPRRRPHHGRAGPHREF